MQDLRAQMAWAWRNYVELAFGQNHIKAVSGGTEEFFLPRGPSLGLTDVEALDTLHLMRLDAELEEGIGRIEKNLRFDIDGEVQVFEPNIRMMAVCSRADSPRATRACLSSPTIWQHVWSPLSRSSQRECLTASSI